MKIFVSSKTINLVFVALVLLFYKAATATSAGYLEQDDHNNYYPVPYYHWYYHW